MIALALEPGLHGPPAQIRRDIVRRLVVAVDGQQLGFELAAENARVPVARGAGNGAPAQGAVDVDRAAGDDLSPGADRSNNGQVAIREDDRLAGADRALNHPGYSARGRAFHRHIRDADRLGLAGL